MFPTFSPWQHEEYGVTRYVFQPPMQPERWIVLIDWVSDFSGRKELATQLSENLPQILASIRSLK
jgi:hypothetical protein